jgi:phosphonate transport system permease protein
MPAGIPSLPQHQLDRLLANYGREVARRRRRWLTVLLVLAALILLSGRYGEVELGNLFRHLSGLTSYFGRILPKLSYANFAGDVGEWYWNFFTWLKLLFDTVLMAYLGTLAGSLGAGMLAFLAAANLAPSRFLRWCVKRLLEFCRTVPDIVFALLFVAAFGLGPLAGVLAIGIHSFGALGKMFTEVVENIDLNPVEGVRSTGGRFADIVRFGALPQILPNLRPASLRDQRTFKLDRRFCRRRRHRPGSLRRHPQVLLHRRQRHPLDDHRNCRRHRSRDGAHPPLAGAGGAVR